MLSIVQNAIQAKEDIFTEEFAQKLIDADELAYLRDEFTFPITASTAKIRKPGDRTVYLCGNSLGIQPKAAREAVVEELDKWAELGVEGHFHGDRPWTKYDDNLRDSTAALVGGLPHEVINMNTLSVNVHTLLLGFYHPNGGPSSSYEAYMRHRGILPALSASEVAALPRRHKIMIEDHAFPSDTYAVKSQILLHGSVPEDSLVLLRPREGEETLRTEDIVSAIKEHGPELSVVMLSGIQYYTGQLFDIPTITAAAHAVGAYCGWDLAHAAGNVPLMLHEWDVDFACWCTYKYINSGPGGVSGAFVHERYARDSLTDRPRLAGWWGVEPTVRFNMEAEFQPSVGATSWQLSCPPVLLLASLRGSLKLFDEAGMARLRQKSLALTAYLEYLVDTQLLGDAEIITPRDPQQRGAQLSIVFKHPVQEIYDRLIREGAIVDKRKPFVIRIAPAPLYNNARDVLDVVVLLKKIIEELNSERNA